MKPGSGIRNWGPGIGVVIALLTAACATGGGVPRPFPSPDWDRADAAPPASSAAPAPLEPTELPVPSAPSAATAPALPAPKAAIPSHLLTARRFDGRAVAFTALGFRGVPYRLGGADPAGFDCSGLVQYVFAQYGIAIPRIVEQQYRAGEEVNPRGIKPGDLMFFSTKGRGATHVGIAIGENQFVHAPTSTGVVRVETLSSAYWGPRYVGARRISDSPETN